jgi:hypothetical protein
MALQGLLHRAIAEMWRASSLHAILPVAFLCPQ